MIDRAGPLRGADRVACLLATAQIVPPTEEVSTTLLKQLHDWNATRAQFGLGAVEDVASLAELLAMSLALQGWPLADIQSGEVQIFACSEDQLIATLEGAIMENHQPQVAS